MAHFHKQCQVMKSDTKNMKSNRQLETWYRYISTACCYWKYYPHEYDIVWM